MKNKNKVLLFSFITLLILINVITASNVLADTINPGAAKTIDCGVFAEITKPIAQVIMVAAPIILLVMGTIDFMGAVAGSDEKAMKKAISNFLKRLIICVVILILPVLVNFVISWTTFGNLTSCW